VTFRRGLVPDFRDAPVRADQVRGTHNAQERLAEELLHPARAISANSFEFGVAEQREIELVLRRELRLGLHGVPAAAQDHGSRFVKFRLGVTKLGRFVDSTGGQRPGKEIQHNGFSAKADKADLAAALVRQAELRSFISYFQHLRFSPARFAGHVFIRAGA